MTRRTQSGAAIIAALLVVVLAATIAMFLLAQQSQALTRTARATSRAQLNLYAPASIDWIRAILRDEQKKSLYVHLSGDWAKSLPPQPLDGALASGVIRDESAKFNLNNLVLDNGTKSAADVVLFQALLKKLGLNTELANALVDWIDTDDETTYPGGAESTVYFSLPEPYRPANQRLKQVDELYRVRGFDADAIRRLSPYVTALPAHNKININTASSDLLALVFPELSADDITTLVRNRDNLPFYSIDDIKNFRFVKLPAGPILQFLDVKSDFFLATLAITGENAQVRQMALLRRNSIGAPGSAAGWPSIIWVKDL